MEQVCFSYYKLEAFLSSIIIKSLMQYVEMRENRKYLEQFTMRKYFILRAKLQFYIQSMAALKTNKMKNMEVWLKSRYSIF